jgi:hypothetical protein
VAHEVGTAKGLLYETGYGFEEQRTAGPVRPCRFLVISTYLYVITSLTLPLCGREDFFTIPS